MHSILKENPIYFRFLIDKYGLSQAFWIIGAILSNICVAGCVYRQPKSLQNDQETSDNGGRLGRQEDKSMKICLGTLNLKFSLFKKRRFVLLLTAITLCTIGSDNNYVIIPAHIKALGYSNTYVTLGVSIVGGTEMIARIFTGWFADLNIMSKIHIFVICTFVGGAMALISPLFDSFTFMAVYAFVAGAFPSTYIALFAVLAIECVGIEDFPAAFTFISIFMALAYLINLPVSGRSNLFTWSHLMQYIRKAQTLSLRIRFKSPKYDRPFESLNIRISLPSFFSKFDLLLLTSP